MPIFVRYPSISLQFIATKDETQLSSNTFSLICLLACANVCKFSWLVRTTHMNCFFFLFGTLTFCLCSVDHAFPLCFTVFFEQTAVYPLFLRFFLLVTVALATPMSILPMFVLPHRNFEMKLTFCQC